MGVPVAVNAGEIEGKLPLHNQAAQYWTVCSYPVMLVKDSHVYFKVMMTFMVVCGEHLYFRDLLVSTCE
jgi:hypothetical protein